MKKTGQFLFSFLAFVLLVWSGVARGQGSSLPYQTDFSSQDDWVLDNGECVNAWHTGYATGFNSALYISDVGQTPHYDYNYPSRVLAKKALQMGSSARVTIEFDANVGGSYYETDDYLKVFLVDELTNTWYMLPSTNGTWGESYPFRASNYENAAYFDGKYYVSKYNGHVTMQVPNPAPNQTAYLVFAWINHVSYSESGVIQTGAIVKNLLVKETPDSDVRLELPKDVVITATGIDSAYVSWIAGRDETTWELKNGENGSIITSYINYYTFTGLTNGEEYTFFLRAKDDNYVSDWVSVEYLFNISPYTHTHGPDSIGENNARLTAAVDWKAFYPPVSYGQGCRRVVDDEWIIVGVDSSYFWDVWGDDPERHVELWSNVSNLQPFTWYNVVSWVVTQEGDTLWSSVDVPHQFCTADGNHFDPVPLPYTATFDENDNWSLTYGYNNFYKGTPSGYSQNALFVSDNGIDAQYNDNMYYSNSFAKKLLKTDGVPYLKVEFDAAIGGRSFWNQGLDNFIVSLAYGDADVNHFWSSESKEFNNESGHFVVYFHNEEQADTVSLMLQWYMESYLSSEFAVENHQPAVVITNLTVSEASAEEMESGCANVNYVSGYFTAQDKYQISWDASWNCQVKLGEDGEEISMGQQSYYAFEDLEPLTDYVAYIRKPCDETLTSYSDWMAIPFSTKFLPELYLPEVTDITATSANYTSYIRGEYEANPITGKGVQFRKESETEWTSAEADSSLNVESYIGSYFVSGVFYSHSSSLTTNTTYVVRAFAETQNGQTAYSNERTFFTGATGLEEVRDNISFVVYPNPAMNQTTLSIESSSSALGRIQVVDMLGREVLNIGTVRLVSGKNNISVNTSSLGNGTYFIRLVTPTGVSSSKLSISK